MFPGLLFTLSRTDSTVCHGTEPRQGNTCILYVCTPTFACSSKATHRKQTDLSVYRLAGSTRGLHVKTPNEYCSEHVFMPLAALFGYNQISMLLRCALGLYDSGRNSLNVIGLLNEVMLLACVGVRSSELKHNVLLSLFSQRGWERIIETNGAFNRILSPSACHVEYVFRACARVQMRGCVSRVCELISEFLCSWVGCVRSVVFKLFRPSTEYDLIKHPGSTKSQPVLGVMHYK